MVLTVPLRGSALRGLLHDPPRPRRVAAWSTALAAHAALLLLLLLPRAPLELPQPRMAPDTEVEWIRPEPVVVPLLPLPPATQRPRALPTPVVAPTPPPVPLAPSTPMSLPAPAPAPDASPIRHQDVLPVAPVGTSQAIAVDSVSPPPYPAPALRRSLEGTVHLLVLVGADGLPERVQVERGSGHRELDRAAREHVLAEWRFHPALRNGRAVPALVRVPIVFRVR